MVLCSAVLLGIVLTVLPEVPFVLFIIGSCAFAFSYGLIFPNVNAIALEPHPIRAGIASSIYGTLTSVGTATVGLIAGGFYDGEPQTMFMLSALSGLCALTVYVFMRRHLTGRLATAE